jgi:hypothetical protein
MAFATCGGRDEFPRLALAGDPNLPIMHETALTAMAGIVSLNSVACQESGLHGLGHWQRTYEREVGEIQKP